MSESGFAIRAEDQRAWAEIVRRAERGESVAVIAYGDQVADVVPSGELDRLREPEMACVQCRLTIEATIRL